MKTIVIAVSLLVSFAGVQATTILFDEGATTFHLTDWIGTYNAATGLGLNIPIGDCANPERCNYDAPIDILFHPEVPAGLGGYVETTTLLTDGRIDIGPGRLDWFPTTRTWVIGGNVFDSVIVRSGAYCVVGFDAGCIQAVPEVPAAWLLLVGSLVLVWMRKS